MFEIGNSLREARLRQHLDFPQVEQATKIRGKYLRALEEEQFEVLPSQTYVKGFLRTYVEVRLGSARGKAKFAGTLERGQHQDFTGKRLWIQASSPEALRMILNNRTIKLRRGGPLVALVTKNGIRPTSK